jgi:hypothetical protein
MSYGQAIPAGEDICIEETSSSPKKVKKPGFFKRWLLNSLKEVVKEEREKEAYSNRGLVTAVSRRDSLDSNPMVMKIYRANGGTIVETTTFDRHKDRHQNQLHIIGHDVDLGQGLSKIITMESLRG